MIAHLAPLGDAPAVEAEGIEVSHLIVRGPDNRIIARLGQLASFLRSVRLVGHAHFGAASLKAFASGPVI